MKQYSDKEMSDMKDDKWLVVNGVEPKIHSKLKVDVTNGGSFIHECLDVDVVIWEGVDKYRLTNNKFFKDGIYNGYADETDESIKHYNNWAISPNPLTYQEAVEEQKKHDGIAIDTDAIKYTLQDNGDYLEDEKKPASTRDKLITMLNDNEAMEAIALEACLEQQKVIDKAKVIEEKERIIEKALVFAELDGKHWTLREFAEHLSKRGFLTLPEDKQTDLIPGMDY